MGDIFQGSNNQNKCGLCFRSTTTPPTADIFTAQFIVSVDFFFNLPCWTKVNKRDLFRRAEKLMWDVEYFWTVTNRKRTHLTKHKCYKTVKIVFSLFYHYTLPTITINFSVNTRKTLQEMFNNPLKVYIVLKIFPFFAYK